MVVIPKNGLRFQTTPSTRFFTLVSFREGISTKTNFRRLLTLITVHHFILLMQSGPIGRLLYLISSDRLNLSLSWSITLTRLKCIAAFELKCLWILWNSLSIEWYRGWTCQVSALSTVIRCKHSDTHTNVLKSEMHCSSQAQRDTCNISAKSPGHHTAFTARKSSTHYSSDHKRTPMRERKRQTLRLIYSNLALFMTAAWQKERPGTSGVILGG